MGRRRHLLWQLHGTEQCFEEDSESRTEPRLKIVCVWAPGEFAPVLGAGTFFSISDLRLASKDASSWDLGYNMLTEQ